MSFSGPLDDRIQIRELYGSYADAVFRQDRIAYLACWHRDGIRRSGDELLRGKDELRMAWDSIWSTIERMAFFSEVGAIQVEGDAATARCYCREIIERKDGKIWKVVGLYEDELTRDRGAWVFLQRRYSLLINEQSL